ncbi:aldo/keto reductase [Gracilimonas mengyeensis]|uniref:Predicted oxidoreductase n=1 Tax=Gracilimonas mengyeensis TaxID=1302730 RepID=A0A521FAX5_9BACT|nr:aldo/keto reductase [Gracilimonas mengyeensis]SMO93327.1 Predicted oxidoreductase [Gracilimonas mengyeensis]
MNYRTLGKTGFEISEISLGTWQLGGKWGTDFDHDLAQKTLEKAIDNGVNFIDTADVYKATESEKAVGKAIKNASNRVYVATKCGRQIDPHTSENYTTEALRGYVEDSLKRLDVEAIDLIQLHCPPTDVYYRPEIFGEFEKMKEEGKILNLGVSVEKVEEGLKALEYDNVTTIQVIYNMFRQRPHELLFPKAKEKNVGLIVRVPLASGLLTGKFTKDTEFGESDHRNFNREGDAFDVGETFSGIPFEAGVEAVDKLKNALPDDTNLVHLALRWVLMRNEVGCVIPGASKVEHVESNLEAAEKPDIPFDIMKEIDKIYESDIKPLVHQRW